MADKHPINGIWTLLGIVGFVALLMVSVAVIYPARLRFERQKEFYNRTKAELESKRAERAALQKDVTALENSPAAIEKVAREKFRFCKDGEIIIYYKDSQN